MSRTPLLTTLLWTSVTAAAVVACDDDPAPIIDAAPPDGTVDAFVGPIAQFPSSLALASECGIALPPTVDLPVQNAGNATLTISGVNATNGFAVTTAFPIDVAPGATVQLAVRPPAAVVGTDVGGASKTGVLSLQSNQPGTTGTVTLTTAIRGANLAITDAASAPLAQVDLSTSTGSCPTAVTVFVRNTGNAEAVVTASGASGFSVGSFAPSDTLAPGGAISHDVGASTTGACIASAAIQYTVTGAVCTTVPISLQANLNIAGSSSCFCS